MIFNTPIPLPKGNFKLLFSGYQSPLLLKQTLEVRGKALIMMPLKTKHTCVCVYVCLCVCQLRFFTRGEVGIYYRLKYVCRGIGNRCHSLTTTAVTLQIAVSLVLISSRTKNLPFKLLGKKQ